MVINRKDKHRNIALQQNGSEKKKWKEKIPDKDTNITLQFKLIKIFSLNS